jgi:hypothetical protein
MASTDSTALTVSGVVSALTRNKESESSIAARTKNQQGKLRQAGPR